MLDSTSSAVSRVFRLAKSKPKKYHWYEMIDHPKGIALQC
jgi:hypothetical protein